MSKAKLSKISIYLPSDAPSQAGYAAEELRHYLGLMSSERVGITSVEQGVCIRLIQEALGDDDSFSIRSSKDGALIKGGKRGIIYGAYELLERLGCRFFTATIEKVPTLTEIVLPELDISQSPAFCYREHNYYELTKYSRFAVKRRLNGAHHPIREKHGGHKAYAWFVHTFQTMVPPSVYGESHPEYFALYDGKRVTDLHVNQLCLTNPDILDIAVESVRAALKARPDAEIISISQNDWGRSCECEKCRERDAFHGSAAGTLLEFVNAIAERLEPEFPNVTFDTLAYNYTRPIPREIRPRHNVCVRLCSIEACFAHSFESCDDDRGVTLPDGTKTDFITDLRNWGSICDNVYIWDYTTNFGHYPAPHPNWHVLQPNIRAFRKNNVKGVFEQACGASAGSTDFNELRAYVISSLLWNPDADVEALITEFTDYVYGEAAPFVREYIEYICKEVEEKNIHAGFQPHTDLPLYSKETVAKLFELMQKAKKAVEGDPLKLWRIAKAELSVRWVELKNQTKLEGVYDAEKINRFFSDWRAFGMTRIDEWCSQETTLRAMLEDVWRGTNLYKHWSGDGPEEL